MKHLGVSNIPSGKEKLLSLDAAEVRDLYEDCRPTPKPRRNKLQDLLLKVWTIREAGCVRNAVREKLQRTPSAKAFHAAYLVDIWPGKKPLMPPSYNKFFTKKDGSIMPRTKESVMYIIKKYVRMKQDAPKILHINNYGRLISIFYKSKSKSDGFWNFPRKVYQDDNGIYGLLEFMYKNKLFNKSPSLNWHFGLP